MKERIETGGNSRNRGRTGVQGRPSAKTVVDWLRRRHPLRKNDVVSRKMAKSRVSRKSEQPGLRTGSGPEFRRILVPIDFSAESTCALKTGSKLASQSGGNLLLVHVVGPIYDLRDYGYGPVQRRRPNEGMMRHARQKLRALGRKHAGENREWRCVAVSGTAPNQILKAAEEFKAELIVMPTRGLSHGPPTEVGGTAERVVRHARCPVLVLPKRMPRKERRNK